MTLPISLTCKTQEPSRTRTLRGTRGTSTGEGPQRRRQRRRRGEAARLDWPAAGRGGGAFNGCWSGRTAPSPAGALAHGHPVVSLGSEASAALLGPFWIKPAPWACLPSPGASQPFCPILLLASPLLPPHPSSLPDLEIPVSPVVGGQGGMLGKGRQPILPHPLHLNLLLPGGPAGVMVTHPDAEV